MNKNSSLHRSSFLLHRFAQFADATLFGSRILVFTTIVSPLSVSLLSSLIAAMALALPHWSVAIFQRLSPSLTVYQFSELVETRGGAWTTWVGDMPAEAGTPAEMVPGVAGTL